MLDEIRALSQLIDIPITVALVIWTLKMLERKETITEKLLERCLEETYEDLRDKT